MGNSELIAALVAVAAIVVAMGALIRWRRAVRIMNTRVLIGEVMRRNGITPADAEAAGYELDVLVAGERCANCASDRLCRVWLSDDPSGSFPVNCPNRDLFDRVAAHKSSICNIDSLAGEKSNPVRS